MAVRLQADARELEARIDDATRALMVQKDTAEQATQAKSRFIAAASHDLRQPLHAIGLFTSTLQRRMQGTELQGVVADLAQAVAVMDRLFNSLLDISRLDAGTLRANAARIPARSAVRADSRPSMPTLPRTSSCACAFVRPARSLCRTSCCCTGS